ncbi:MAG: peptide chain release factor 1 [Streptosporangiales bacterium]
MVDVPAELLTEHAELERRLADPAVHADQGRVRDLGRRYATLHRIVETHAALSAAEADLEAARELASQDASFAAEVTSLEERTSALGDRLHHLLTPRDPSADKDALLEVKAGEGGEESALFAADLLRMYTRYAERLGFAVEVLDRTESGLGGYKDVTVAVKARGAVEPGEGPYGLLRFEGGVHRVQRVPVTESQGRIHTSAAGVLVFPEAEEFEVEIEEKDLRIDVFRSSGPGGQSVNTTDSAVRITHQPTGVVVSCQNERSQLQNRERAMRMLRAKLLAIRQEEAEREQASARRSQVRTVDRSERVRTYNFPENRISDHRTGYKAYNLDQVLEGALDPVITSLVDADAQERLASA